MFAGYEQANTMLQGGYSIINTTENKKPMGSWKLAQTNASTTLSQSPAYGMITGYNDVEAIDVDLKILAEDSKNPTTDELINMQLTWNLILNALRESIKNFDEKVTIVKTINHGYHIIYRAKNIEGNLKLASNTENEALIETRGVGGFVMIYDDVIARDYSNLRYIIKEDRNALIEASRGFNEAPEKEVIEYKPKGVKRAVNEGEVLPIDDYKNRVSTLDVLASNGWTILDEDAQGRTKVLRPNNPTSEKSGSVFPDGNLFVFSSSTQFEEETPYNVFDVYRILEHNGDVDSAIRSIVSQGYGVKAKQVEAPIKEVEEVKVKEDNAYPIHVLPEIVKMYFESKNKSQGLNIDFMSNAFLIECLGYLGNSVRLEIEDGRSVQMNAWAMNVGVSGQGKSPSEEVAQAPFEALDEVETYKYQELCKSWTKDSGKSHPVNQAYRLNDATDEKRISKMGIIERGVLISVDEISKFLDDEINNGTSKTLLSAYSNRNLSQERMSEKIADRFVTKAGLSIFGGIQPKSLYEVYDSGKASGFMARFLVAFPERELWLREVSRAKRKAMFVNPAHYERFVNDFVSRTESKHFFWSRDNQDKVISKPTHFYTEEAEEYFLTLENIDKKAMFSSTINSAMSPIYTKMQDYRAKFSVLLHILHGEDSEEVGIKYVKMAQELCNYYIFCHNKLFKDKNVESSLDNIVGDKYLSMEQKVHKMQDEGRSKKETSDALAISQSQVGKLRASRK
tara:strand:+ start:1100 stop:3310 length:2211 start_codon:yes stop_codon:yes gene_type:complete